MTTTPTLFETAQGYAERGYVCVPVRLTLDTNGAKRVDAPSWRGRVFDREDDWTGYTGIAINTGASGIVAVDIDTGDGKDGFAALEAAGVELPATPVKATTQSGGQHWLYRACSVPVKSSAGSLAAGVDVRGEGGLLFVSPTRVEGTDRAYRWQPDTPSLRVDQLPEFPTDLACKLSITSRPTISLRGTTTNVTRAQREWALQKIDYKLRDIAAAGDGDRNRVLGKAIPRIVGLVKTIGDDLEPYAEKILAAYIESGGDDEKQVDDWVSSSIRYAKPEDASQWMPADRVAAFWDSRPELRQIKQASQAGMASPWAVLGALCVRVLADVPPTWRTVTGIGDPAGGNLNLYAVLAAESGGGKGIATQVARHLWPSDVHSTEIASGEALPKLFAKRVKDSESGEWRTEKLRDSVIIDAPEFGSLSASGARTGATLTQRLCNGFSGEGLSFAVSDESKNVDVLPNSYRLGVITGVQYGNAGLLLDSTAAVTGVPQRFVWFPANVKPDELPDVRPDMPGPLNRRAFPPRATRIEVCAEARRDIEAAQRAKLIGDTESPLDGHKLYARVKLAYALAALSGHTASVRPEDWYLSGIVMEVSDATRQRAVDTLKRGDRNRAEAAGKREGIRKAAAAESEADEAIRRMVGNLSRWLRNQSDGANDKQLSDRIRSDKRETFYGTVKDSLLADGLMVERSGRFYATAADAADAADA